MRDTSNTFSNVKSNSVNALQAYSRLALPTTVNELFDWGEWMWMKCGEYSQAINKIISYFLVDIEITGVKGHDVKVKYKDYLKEDLKIMQKSYIVSKDIFTYGNCFLSFYVPINRTLHCPKCHAAFPIQRVTYEFGEKGVFRGKCMSCKKDVTFKRRDTKKPGDEFKIIRWDPRDIHIEYNQITEECVYYYTPNSTVLGNSLKENPSAYYRVEGEVRI